VLLSTLTYALSLAPLNHKHITHNTYTHRYLNRLNDAVDSHEKAEIAAVVLHEGLAHVCLITPYMTQTRARIERKMPKKKDMGDKAGKGTF